MCAKWPLAVFLSALASAGVATEGPQHDCGPDGDCNTDVTLLLQSKRGRRGGSRLAGETPIPSDLADAVGRASPTHKQAGEQSSSFTAERDAVLEQHAETKGGMVDLMESKFFKEVHEMALRDVRGRWAKASAK
mmetsp:Transcript_57296/g.159475  ORF Transcript_57296/g.159475 Transcript_57296/m.159475 type:complete len:134 (+) Transcript_57296:78-479(+)